MIVLELLKFYRQVLVLSLVGWSTYSNLFDLQQQSPFLSSHMSVKIKMSSLWKIKSHNFCNMHFFFLDNSPEVFRNSLSKKVMELFLISKTLGKKFTQYNQLFIRLWISIFNLLIMWKTSLFSSNDMDNVIYWGPVLNWTELKIKTYLDPYDFWKMRLVVYSFGIITFIH